MAKAKGQGQRKGRGGSRVYGPNHGKNIERRREGDEWFFRFEIDGHEHYGSCRTTDKAKAEGIAADEKAERKVEARRNREDGVGPMRWLAARNNWWNAKGSKNAETGLEARLDWLTEQIGEKTLLRDIDARRHANNARGLRARTTRAVSSRFGYRPPTSRRRW
jgi:hypothetical protein